MWRFSTVTTVPRKFVLRSALLLMFGAAGSLVQGKEPAPPAVPGVVTERPAAGRFVEVEGKFLVPYEAQLPNSEIRFTMQPIPGGVFRLGSPAGEAGHQASEGPQFEVVIEPFWIGQYEVTWAEYKQFMSLYDVFKEFGSMRSTLATKEKTGDFADRKAKLVAALGAFADLEKRVSSAPKPADTITAPTKLYEPSHTFEFGDDPRLPAVTMTQYAARQYTKWLTAVLAQYYRLPSEAEWEYACRAGTQTAFSFGDDPKQLTDYAWYFENNADTIHKVGLKKPNPWGLYDMHGNAAEWVLDQFHEDGYQQFKGGKVTWREALAWPTEEFPRVVRGGHWDSDAAECRSAARLGSHDENWKALDPNIPLSPWWFTSDPARGVGFRVIRPYQAPPIEEQQKSWNLDAEVIRSAVADRLQEGRGAEDAVDADLPKAIQQLQELKKKLP